MKKARSKKIPRHRRHEIARKAADTKLQKRANVVGSCFGLKTRGGQRTDQLCFTVLVEKKVPLDQLRPKDVIPKKVRRHGRELPTDVIETGRPRNEGYEIDHGTAIGTLGCFAGNAQGLFGVSCEHCIGPEQPGPPPDVLILGPTNPTRIWLGWSVHALNAPGLGAPPNFGFFDAGLTTIADPNLSAYISGRAPLPVFRPPSPTMTPMQMWSFLRYTPLNGFGAVSGSLQAVVAGVYGTVFGAFFDLMITAPAPQTPLTRPGDSGMIWIDPYGNALGMHVQGDAMGPGGASSICTYACFAFRVADQWQVNLISA